MPSGPPAPTPYARLVRALAGVVLCVCAAVLLVGWVLDVSAVRSIVPGAVGMKSLTAVGLAAGAAALILPRGRLATALALVPGTLGAIVLAEYLAGVDLAVDELLFTDEDGRRAGIAYPGRFAPTTGVCFLFLTSALLTLDRPGRWRWRPHEVLAIPMGVVAAMSLIGYAFSLPDFYGPASAAKMAVNTAACFFLLAVAVILARPRGRILELATTTDPGGVVVRRLVPICVVVPLILGWLHLRVVDWGLMSDHAGAWWLAAVTAAGFTWVLWVVAGNLSTADRARRELEHQLAEQASRDGLTGLYNRGRFEEELDTFLARSQRRPANGALLLFDLDRLKPVNDELGHVAGDELIRAVALAAQARVRASDVLARIGGDEFAVLLNDTDATGANAMAEDVRRAISAVALHSEQGVARTTASIGVLPLGGALHDSTTDLMARVDAVMYDAKRAGGDRVGAFTVA